MSNANDPTVSELGEGGILRRILAETGPSRAVVGPGDDAAVLAVPGGRVLVTTDTLVHGPDFRLAWSSGVDLGWKAAAVNLADVAGMGGRATALFVALAMPAETRASFVSDLARGMRAACDELAPGCGIEGGDLTISDTLTVAVTAIGVLDDGDAVLRSGARPGDVVALAGDAGVAARGLHVLFERFRDEDGALLSTHEPSSPGIAVRAGLSRADAHALDRQLRPHPPIQLGPVAAAHGATAMMDVSDGLALDATRLAEASGVCIEVRTDLLGADPLALSGGEDHALLATFASDSAVPDGFRVIGRVTAGPVPLLVDGVRWTQDGGWDPYRDWDAARG